MTTSSNADREQFENWYRSKWPETVSESEYRWAVRRRNSDGMYAEQDIRLAWQAWQEAWKFGAAAADAVIAESADRLEQLSVGEEAAILLTPTKRWFLTWAIEDRHGGNGFFSEVIEGDDWESHVAGKMGRQQPNDSGRFVSQWRLVLLAEMQSAGNVCSDRLKEVIDRYEQ